jgi:predicted RNA polymerase sigma factor
MSVVPTNFRSASRASREPLGGSVQLTIDGPWLAVGYQGGVEVFSTVSALRALATAATAPRARADLLARIGDADAAVATLAQALAAATDPQQRRGLGDDLLELLVEQAAARAAAGDLPGALALFDARADALRDRPLRLRWHLARLELCRARGDLARGWAAVDTANYLIVHHGASAELLRRLVRDLEAMRALYERAFPPAAPIDRLAVVRVCRNRDEYHLYGGPNVVGDKHHREPQVTL